MFKKQTKILRFFGDENSQPLEKIVTYSLFGIKLYVTILKHYDSGNGINQSFIDE